MLCQVISPGQKLSDINDNSANGQKPMAKKNERFQEFKYME